MPPGFREYEHQMTRGVLSGCTCQIIVVEASAKLALVISTDVTSTYISTSIGFYFLMILQVQACFLGISVSIFHPENEHYGYLGIRETTWLGLASKTK